MRPVPTTSVPTTSLGAMELRRAIAIFRRRLVLLVVLIVVGLAAAYLGSSRAAIYQAQTTVYVGRSSSLDSTTEVARALLADTFAFVIPSPAIAQTAIAATHVRRSPDQVAAATKTFVAPGTTLIRISVDDSDPVVAAALANATAKAFVDVTRQVAPLVESPVSAIDGLRGTASTSTTTPTATAPAKGPTKATTTTTTAPSTTTTAPPLAVAGRAPTAVAQPATVPASPLHSSTKRNVALGGLAGLIVGVAVVILVDYFGLHARSPQELEDQFGLPVLGVVPHRSQPDSPGSQGSYDG